MDGADLLLPKLTAGTILADKGYDADKRVIDLLQSQGKTAVIPPKRNRIAPREYDKGLFVLTLEKGDSGKLGLASHT